MRVHHTKGEHFLKAQREYGRLYTMMNSSISSTHCGGARLKLRRVLHCGERLAARNFFLEKATPWLVFLGFGLLYSFTTAPSIVALFDDTLEFQLVLPTFGIAHPTGYPLYTLLGGLWVHSMPVGNWAWRTNLLSAIFAAATMAALFVCARRITATAPDGDKDNWVGLAAVLAFGLGPVWWEQATVAEVYALHNLFVIAILALAIPPLPTDRKAVAPRVALLAALIGLGLAHHRTLVLVLPGLFLYLLWTRSELLRPQRIWLVWLAAFAAPLLLYLYIPLRAAQGVSDLNGSYVNTWAGFWDHVLARRYASFFEMNELSRAYDAAGWLMLWVRQTGWVGALLSLLGLLVLHNPKQRPAWALILSVLVVNLLFALYYRVGDPEVFWLPVYLCAALFAAGGLAWMQRALPTPWRCWIAPAAIVLLLAGLGRGAAVNRADDWAAHDYAVDMAKVAFPSGSRVIGLEGEMTALRYMQEAERLGLAATPIVANPPAERRAVLQKEMANGAPVYLTRELEGVAEQYSFTGEGPLVRVWPRGEVEEHSPATSISLSLLDGRLQIEGYDLQRLEWAGGPMLRVTLYWRPLAPVDRDLKVSLRIVDVAGTPLAGKDGAPAVVDAHPLRRVAGTRSWPPGVQVRDVHEVPWPLHPAEAQALIIFYDAETLREVGRIQFPLSRL
ncbi:MAG: DUF2723 domain-containing protein [Caldilinea sp.]|nr:DUF2723 domain-containing protein [Caldilinea sp.]MDW8439625.1 DUF2723 domain-containing protein [Caldilineaceae bacterium]